MKLGMIIMTAAFTMTAGCRVAHWEFNIALQA